MYTPLLWIAGCGGSSKPLPVDPPATPTAVPTSSTTPSAPADTARPADTGADVCHLAWVREPTDTRHTLLDVWSDPELGTWAVGEVGTLLQRDAADGSWHTLPVPTRGHLLQITGAPAVGVWFGGVGYCTGGSGGCDLEPCGLFRLDATGAVEAVAPEVFTWIQGLWTDGQQVAWVSDNTTVHRSDDLGATWSTELPPLGWSSTIALDGLSADDLYLLQLYGLWHTEGGAWVEQPLPRDDQFYAMWIHPDRMFLATYNRYVFQRDADGEWTGGRLDLPATPLGLWGSSADDVYLVAGGDFSPSGAVYHTTGDGTWTPVLEDTPPLYAIDGTSAEDLYAVGAEGAVYHARCE
ncbi:MAG: hypothetical protein R3F59_24590 [Myxococcota bacterium]